MAKFLFPMKVRYHHLMLTGNRRNALKAARLEEQILLLRSMFLRLIETPAPRDVSSDDYKTNISEWLTNALPDCMSAVVESEAWFKRHSAELAGSESRSSDGHVA